MKIAILGATSQIARDFVEYNETAERHQLFLYARRPEAVLTWLKVNALDAHEVGDFAAFGRSTEYDAILNFVGVGDPAQAKVLGASILETTQRYDGLVLDYLHQHPQCRYLFLSSGAVYGGNFAEPATAGTPAIASINTPQPQDWYGWSKLVAECHHRSLAHLAIVDLRVFSYFSRSQNVQGRFLIADMLRAIHNGTEMQTAADYIVRDYVIPQDFYHLVNVILKAPPQNCGVDCYSRAPVDKPTLLTAMAKEFGLRYAITSSAGTMNATGAKAHYYSEYRRAAEFDYQPLWTSIEGITSEARILLDNLRENR